MSRVPYSVRSDVRCKWHVWITTAAALAALIACAPRADAAAACAGDCNGDGAVSNDETLIGANLALGTLSLRSCPPADRSGDGTVSVAEAVAAVGGSLNGCAAPRAGQVMAAANGPAQIELGVVTGSAGGPVRTPNLFRLNVTASRLDLPGPFTTDPVAAMLATTGFQRPDSIGGCAVQHQGVVTTCRESGIVP